MSQSKLEEREEDFCLFYREMGNGREAALAAGYPARTAEKEALRLLAELFPFLPLAILAFLAIPGFGFTGSLAVLFLMGALLAAVLLARLLRLILGSFLLPSFLSGLLLGLLAAFGSL